MAQQDLRLVKQHLYLLDNIYIH